MLRHEKFEPSSTAGHGHRKDVRRGKTAVSQNYSPDRRGWAGSHIRRAAHFLLPPHEGADRTRAHLHCPAAALPVKRGKRRKYIRDERDFARELMNAPPKITIVKAKEGVTLQGRRADFISAQRAGVQAVAAKLAVACGEPGSSNACGGGLDKKTDFEERNCSTAAQRDRQSKLKLDGKNSFRRRTQLVRNSVWRAAQYQIGWALAATGNTSGCAAGQADRRFNKRPHHCAQRRKKATGNVQDVLSYVMDDAKKDSPSRGSRARRNESRALETTMNADRARSSK